MNLSNLPEDVILRMILELDDDSREYLCRTNKRIARICIKNENYIYSVLLGKQSKRKIYKYIKTKPDCLNPNFMKISPNYRDDDGNTCLMNAMINVDDDFDTIIPEIIKLTPNINAVNRDKETALHLAVRHLMPGVVIEYLIKAGAKVNMKNADGDTPLDFAVDVFLSHGEPAAEEAIKQLLYAGAMVTNDDILHLMSSRSSRSSSRSSRSSQSPVRSSRLPPRPPQRFPVLEQL